MMMSFDHDTEMYKSRKQSRKHKALQLNDKIRNFLSDLKKDVYLSAKEKESIKKTLLKDL